MENPTTTTNDKGTVTSLSSMFSTEEAQKAAKLVHDKIADKQTELNTLKSFISDNTNLVNLVQRLPDQLHHDIMVPFGKAAFFPGRLIHTNEFMVLLGEGYHAERTSKQTVDILKRRGKALESQVDSLKANMEDLKAEASFFDATASEAAEGLVEIREDYQEDDATGKTLESAEQRSSASAMTENKKITIGEEEYARIMSMMDELEKEELAAENNKDKDQNKQDETSSVQASPENLVDPNLRKREEYHLGRESHVVKSECATAMEHIEEKLQQNFTDHLNLQGLTIKSVPKDEISSRQKLPLIKGNANHSDTTSKSTEVSQIAQVLPLSSEVFTSSSIERSHAVLSTPRQNTSEVSKKASQPRFDSSKAFTGSIVERSNNLQSRQGEQGTLTSSDSSSSKPVSRFRAQRR